MQRRFIRLRWDYVVSPSAWCQREGYGRQADQAMFLSRDARSQYLEVRRITDAAPKILSWVLSRQGTC